MFDKLLADTARAGLYHALPAQARGILKAARKRHFTTCHADLSASRTMPEALADLGRKLAFPDWYGSNLDALHDCLCDPDWHPEKDIVIIIDGLEHLRLSAPEAFATLIEVLQAAAETRRDAGHAFWLLLDTTAAGLSAFPEA